MVAGAQSEDEAGRVVPFGKYLLDALIAEGGMARVYRARLRGALGFEKPLVVKQVRPELARDPRFVAMFVEEAKTLVRLSHPHIVPVYELGVVDGTYFLAMELVEGATLATLMRDGPLPPTLVARLGEQIAEALHHAHDRFGLVHRDVTPRNVLVDVEGHARLVDFGIATPAEGLGGEVFGSPGYMSPEQLRGESLDARSDLFALGAVLYQALAGQAAFLPHDLRAVDAKAASAAAKVATLAGRVPALSAEIPEALRSIVRDCLAPDRADRPASAANVARALRTWLAHAAPGGVGAELAARVRETVARHARPHDDAGPVTVTSKKGEERTLATAAVLTDALERSRDGGERARKKSAADPADPAKNAAEQERDGVERTAPLERERPSIDPEAAPPAPQDSGTMRLERSSESERSAGASAGSVARREEDSTQPIVREPRVRGEGEPEASVSRPESSPTETSVGAGRVGAGRVGAGRAVPSSGRSDAERPASTSRLAVVVLALALAGAAVIFARWPAAEPRPSHTPGVARTSTTEPSPERPPESVSDTRPETRPTTDVSRPIEPNPVPTEPTEPIEPAVAARGYVTLHATPWAEVELDGRPLGTTPVRRTAVPPGSHVLVFENPPLGRSLRVPIRVEPGGNLRVLADLSTDDPRARIR